MKDGNKTKERPVGNLVKGGPKSAESQTPMAGHLPGMPLHEINWRKKIPEGLQAEGPPGNKEELFYTVFNVCPASMVICGLRDGRIIEVNESFLSSTGYRREELIGRIIMSLNIWKDTEQLAMAYRTIMEKGLVDDLEAALQTKSGEPRVGLYSARVVELGGEKCILGVTKDITDRIRLAEERKKNYEKYRVFVENADAGLIYVTAEGVIEVINSVAAGYLGSTPEYLTAKKMIESLDKDSAGAMMEKINRVVSEGQGVLERETKKINGKEHFFIKYYHPIPESPFGMPIVQIVIRDITEIKNLENEMSRLEKMNLIGQMAAGISHELRNPMTTVRGLLQILGSKEELIKYKEHFNIMIGELDRANSIIIEFLSLARNRPSEKKMQSLNVILESLLPLITADAMSDNKYINKDLNNIPDLLLEEKEIRQLILNLVRNGLEAMSPGGTLTIRTFVDGPEVMMAIEDQGEGIKPEILNKIGTPFFTTKDYGTGLGLAICNKIAAGHRATIKIERLEPGTAALVRFHSTLS